MRKICSHSRIMMAAIFVVCQLGAVLFTDAGLKQKASSNVNGIAYAAEEAQVPNLDELTRKTDPATATKAHRGKGKRKWPPELGGQSFNYLSWLVPEVGVEPTWTRGPRDFESRASTNFTTPAGEDHLSISIYF